MSALDKPKPIDQVLKGKILTVGPEHIAALTEEELLGLDRPTHELVGHGQSLIVPKTVRYLYETEDPAIPEQLLARFGLNIQRYDSEKNPHGLFAVDIRLTPRAVLSSIKGAALFLSGVRTEEMAYFFGVGADFLRGKTSVALSEAMAVANRQRETFAFRHQEQFPKVQRELNDIKKLSGLDWEQLFIPGRVPPARSWRSRAAKYGPKILLDEVLSILSLALSGSFTISDIAHAKHHGHSVVHTFLLSERSPLTDVARATIKEKIKKDPRRRGRKPVSPSE